MPKKSLSDGAKLSRAARHLIQIHGSRAAAIAIKRAAYLINVGRIPGRKPGARLPRLYESSKQEMTHTAAKKEMDLSRALHIRTHGFPYFL
jgi:hypothetical protein